MNSNQPYFTLVNRGLFLISTVFAVVSCSKEVELPSPPPPAVIVVTAQQERVKPSVEFVGRIESMDDVKIRSRVGGVLLKRFFKEGEDIKKGTPLFEIDPAPFKAVLSDRKARVNKANSDVDIAKRNYKRGKKLAKDGLISQLDMDKLSNQLDSATASLQQAQAGLEEARLNLSYTKINAPLDGRVGKSMFALGDVINPSSDTLTTLVKLDPMYVSFQINEKAMISVFQRDLQQNQEKKLDYIVKLRFSNDTLYGGEGKIDFLNNRVDSTTGTMSLRALFDNPENLLLPGQYVDVIILTKDDTQAILIPQSSVQEDQQGRFVMIVDQDNKVSRRRVEMGSRYDINWEVNSGLKVGDRVIVEGLQKVRASIVVKPTEQKIKPFETPEGTQQTESSQAQIPQVQ